ncbi:ABC-2 type transport system ATP-binding protein [Methylomarinovum caldicuralii]|uniref:ABC-2 type transport system ATP-binding protein n=1 Tax=Methylomarinovum caldicuralii TaxID=438856 RepID=A0AAU9CP72_9GAMM|nr:ABC transporter ATP-binding protein [Methylomarinovum caldicuralii]BCX81327.1 ABC-2 type transport system ATP-binding protein [Methylomarinovum caldicuralii]
MTTPALEVEHVSFAYGPQKALDDVTFSVEAGRCAILLGPNGAGKTTLFNLITRLFDSPTGAIRIAGYDNRRQPCQALAHLGVVFQQPTLDLDLTVAQNLRYHAALHGLSRREADRRIAAELERLEMIQYRKTKVRALSGGYRRRVEIARALLHCPALLLLDEPTVGLDIPSRMALVEHVHGLAREGMGVLWATHLIDEVEPSDALIVLHRGKVRATGIVTEVIRRLEVTTLAEVFEVLTAEETA